MQATSFCRQTGALKGKQAAKEALLHKRPAVCPHRLVVKVHSYGAETKQPEYTWSRYGTEADASENSQYPTNTFEYHSSSPSRYDNDDHVNGSSRNSSNGASEEEDAPAAPGTASVLESNPLFTPEFVAALQSALVRNGDDALTSASVPIDVSDRISVAEEVVHLAIKTAKTNVRAMLAMQRQIEEVVNNEKKQVARMEFLLEKIQNENAYMRVLQTMVDEDEEQRSGGSRMPWP